MMEQSLSLPIPLEKPANLAARSSAVHIDFDRCKACGLCVANCPRAVLELGEKLNRGGFAVVVVKNGSHCVGCANCYYSCPEPDAVTVEVRKNLRMAKVA